MGDFKIHRARFFDYMPGSINCIAYDKETCLLAVGRVSSIDIWMTGQNWYHWKVIPGSEQRKVNSVVWVKGRLFSADLQGNITEYDLVKLSPKVSHFYGHGFWCMEASHDQTRLALGCEDGCVRLYKILEKGVVYERAFEFQKGRVISLAWHQSDMEIVTGSSDNIRVWNVSTGQVKQRMTVHRLHHHKEAIIWCIAVLSDFTIVSGSSQGQTQFWDGKRGVGLQTIFSHKADILSICVSPDERTVCTSGVDSRIVQFHVASVMGDSSKMEWTKACVSQEPFHDVKALAIVKDMILSGGMDTILRGTPLHCTASLNNSQVSARRRNDLPFPMKPLVQTAPKANLILCQHQNSLEIWRLGLTEEDIELKDGDTVPVISRPSKLIELKSKSGEEIVCSALSSCGGWLAYSTIKKIRLYKVTIDPLVLHKVPVIPNSIIPAHKLMFTNDNAKLLSVTNLCSVQLITLDEIQPSLFYAFPPMEHPISQVAMGTKGAIAVVADDSGLLKLLNCKVPSKEIVTTLPRYKPILAMSVNPSGSFLFVVYTDRTFQEFSLHQQTFSKWSSKAQSYCPKQWMERKQSIIHVEYNPTNDNQLLLMDNTSFTLLNKSVKPPSRMQPLFIKETAKKRNWQGTPAQKAKHGMAVCEKYKPILFAGFLADPQTILIVERPIKAIYEKLPPAFHQKKFGT